MKISNSLSKVLNSIQFSHSEHIFLQTLMYPVKIAGRSLQPRKNCNIAREQLYYLFFFRSGFRDAKLIQYRMVTSSTPYMGLRFPRLCTLNIKFLCFLSLLMWSLPFPPSKVHPGSLIQTNILPFSYLFSSYMPPLCPFLCIQPNLLQCLIPPIVRPPSSVRRRATNPLASAG